MSSLTQNLTNTTAAAAPHYVSAFTMDITGFFLSLIFMALITGYILLSIFGTPVVIAAATKQAGKSLIQHFNTPKSAEFKQAQISGEAFQYADIKDGTVSATPESVESVGGLTTVVTFAQLGVTIPIRILGAISALIQAGINNHKDLKAKYTELRPEIVFKWDELPGAGEDGFYDFLEQNYNLKCSEAPEILGNENEISILSGANQINIYQENGIVTLTINNIFVDEFKISEDKTVFREVPYFKKDEVLISGYDFNNFETTLKQNDQIKLIPLTIEAAPNFTDKNINAALTESKIMVTRLIDTPLLPGFGQTGQLIGIAIAITLMVLASTVIK